MGEISYKPLIRDMTWSYSRIKAFEACPYRWYLKYILFPHMRGKEMFFASYGKFVHELIASYYSGEKTAPEIEMEYLAEFKNRVQGRAPNKTVFKNYFLSALTYIRRLKEPKNKILAVEEKVEFSVDDISFIGYVDRIEQDENGELIIVDNKSKTLKPRSKRSKPTKTDKELDDYLRQLYLYAIPVMEEYKMMPTKLRFDCYRNQEIIDETFDESAFKEAKAWAKQMVEKISNETDFKPDVEFFKCSHLCEMQDYCEYYDLLKG